MSIRTGLAGAWLVGLSTVALAQEEGARGEGLRTRNVAIVVWDGVELLDFAGPGEVFEAAGNRARAADGGPAFRVYTVAPEAGPILSQGFLTVQPRYTIEDCPEPDIIVIPGGGTNELRADDRFIAWVGDVVPKADVAMSVCTGAFVLADIGALDSLAATTHWGSIAGLARAAPNTEVRSDVRFVDSGRVVTTAGVSAGIDGSLHVVARLLGRTAAEDTARYMEYEWRPDPERLASYPMYSPDLDAAGLAAHKADRLFRDRAYAEAIDAYRAYLRERPEDGEAWYRLGYCLITERRLEESLEANRAAERLTEGRRRSICIYNQACALALLGRTEAALDALERSIEGGYRNRAFIEADADLAGLRETERFKGLMAGLE